MNRFPLNPDNPKIERLLTTGQAANVLQIAPGTLNNWRWLGEGPPFIRRRRRIYYKMNDLISFLDEISETYRSTSEWKADELNKK